ILSIINNLVANAVEAIQDTGTITICIDKQHEWVEFYIYDDGPGISDKYRELIFKPGFTTKYDHLGKPSTGIGLTYVKETVEKLNGEVTIQRGSEGTGSVFTIRLPIDHLVEKG
ncbi:sensor histidine kinase, partial [Bacillus taeanensis]